MDGLIGPDEGSRWAYSIGPSNVLKAVKNTPCTMYLDAQLTLVAPIKTTLGAVVEESVVTTDVFSRFPLFMFPVVDDVLIDKVYTSLGGGPVVTLYARFDDRLDSLGEAIAAAQSAAIATAAADATTKADAARDQAIIAAVGAPTGQAIVFGGF
jgi:hypothetical protein